MSVKAVYAAAPILHHGNVIPRALPLPARRLALAAGPCLLLSSSLLVGACFQDGGPGESSETGVSTVASTVATSEGGSSSEAGSSSDASAAGTSTSTASGSAGTTEPVATSAETSTGESTSSTSDGESCVAPLVDCDGDGDCDDLETSFEHCGACGSPCSAVCEGGECLASRIVFVTSGKAGGFTGAASMDGYCDSRAGLAGLPGEYVAWVSDEDSSAAERMTHSTVPWMLLTDVVVANGWDDLTDGTLQAPINVNELGDTVDGDCDDIGAWSGTNPDGSHKPGANCVGWTSLSEADSAAVIGSAAATNVGWSDGGCPPRSCDQLARMFCFQK